MDWCGHIPLSAAAGPNHYTFLNSPTYGSDWGTKENLAGLPCGDAANYNDRLLPVVAGDTTIKHCFGSCESDGSCPAAPGSFIDITFTLNVSSITSAGVMTKSLPQENKNKNNKLIILVIAITRVTPKY